MYTDDSRPDPTQECMTGKLQILHPMLSSLHPPSSPYKQHMLSCMWSQALLVLCRARAAQNMTGATHSSSTLGS